MRNHEKIVWLVAAGVFGAAAADAARAVAGPVAGTRMVRIAESGGGASLLSLPFLKPAVARGRIDAVGPETGRLTDREGGFAVVGGGRTHIARITDGASRGDWFLLDPEESTAETAVVADDGLAGESAALEAGAAFAVHELFQLRELFPEDGARIAAAGIDVRAAQVHFFDGEQFSKFWLSDGSITGHRGWTRADGGELRYAGDTAILPGTSFLFVHPPTEQPLSLRIRGAVPARALTVPVFPGYNFLGVQHSEASAGRPADGFPADGLGLVESGFRACDGSEGGDRVFAFDAAAGDLGDGYYYDGGDGVFRTTREDSAGFAVAPGGGFIVFNSGDAYHWETKAEGGNR